MRKTIVAIILTLLTITAVSAASIMEVKGDKITYEGEEQLSNLTVFLLADGIEKGNYIFWCDLAFGQESPAIYIFDKQDKDKKTIISPNKTEFEWLRALVKPKYYDSVADVRNLGE